VAQIAKTDTVVDVPMHSGLRDPSGRRRLVEGCCAPIHAADNAVIGTVLVVRDVTERERLEQELQRASKLESVGVLAGGIAHDFNNILTAVIGNLNLALLGGEDPAERQHSLKEAERAALQARELTQQLLTFAKGGEPVRATVHLPEVLRQTAEFTVRGSRVRCEFDLAEELWLVDADRGQISQVVQNLVLNAVQAMPAGGVVRLAANNLTAAGGTPARLAAGDYVHLAVTDAGVGIAPEHVPRVFDPYFTTKQQGSGLGLATVYSIVTKHRGHVDVQSEPGRGTTFHLWLPALRNAQPAPPPEPAAISGELHGRVLVMDDEPPICRLLGALLRRSGLTVATTVDGREAVEQFRAAREAGAPFDLVIMDLTVPGGMGGLEALEHLRAIDPGLKAIVSSGYSSDPVLANFRAHGFRGRVAKPYEVAELLNVVRDVLAE
jgi:signal transduction histidine kinase/ActR/RegA family two-component response regulator